MVKCRLNCNSYTDNDSSKIGKEKGHDMNKVHFKWTFFFCMIMDTSF